jgi:hypothetical protein
MGRRAGEAWEAGGAGEDPEAELEAQAAGALAGLRGVTRISAGAGCAAAAAAAGHPFAAGARCVAVQAAGLPSAAGEAGQGRQAGDAHWAVLQVSLPSAPLVRMQFDGRGELRAISASSALLSAFAAVWFLLCTLLIYRDTQVCCSAVRVRDSAVRALLICRDAQVLVKEPMERLKSLAKALAGTLFALPEGHADEETQTAGAEAAFLEGAMSKIGSLFDVTKHKVTTVYTAVAANDQYCSVWTIDVKRERELVKRGKGSSHRITRDDLRNLQHAGPKKALVRRLMFRDFLMDPQAARYFMMFLERGETGAARLAFFQEVEQLAAAIAETHLVAKRLYRQYVEGSAGIISEKQAESIRQEVMVQGRLGPATFSRPADAVLAQLRDEDFGAFLDRF